MRTVPGDAKSIDGKPCTTYMDTCRMKRAGARGNWISLRDRFGRVPLKNKACYCVIVQFYGAAKIG